MELYLSETLTPRNNYRKIPDHLKTDKTFKIKHRNNS